MTQLSIVMPSNRSLKASKGAIESALRFAAKTGCRFILSDNSGDVEKRRYFEHHSPNMTYVVPPNDDALLNQMTALSHVETPFLIPMGDDDEIYSLDGRQPIDLAGIPSDVIGIRPRTLVWTIDNGVRQTERFEISAFDAGERLLEYNGKARGNNSIYYSIFRTDVFRGLLKLFAEHHPTCGAYCDWAITFALVAAGRVVFDPSTIYRYDLGRWAEKQSAIETKRNLFLQSGLPGDTEKFSALLRFLDVHCFLATEILPLSAGMRSNAVATNARLALSTFLREVKNAPQNYGAEVLRIADEIAQASDIARAVELSFSMTDEILPGLGERYARFYQAARDGR